MKLLFASTLLLLISGCGMIEINESGYRSISSLESHHIKPFEASKEPSDCKELDRFMVYEINSKQILDTIKKQPYTWVHIWLPYCPNESCTNINQYENLENKYKNKGLNLLFISKSYDLSRIISTANQSNFSKSIYVLDGAYFGYKNKEISKKLYQDLNTNAQEDDNYFYTDYLFKGDTLVYMGYEVSDSIIQSIF